jgi:meiosis arrest female protein 1
MSLPSVRISVKDLSGRIHSLLDSHSGCLPLATVVDCHDAHFTDTPLDRTGEPAVPLEHLISCVRGIAIHKSGTGRKTIRWTEKDKSDEPHPLAESQPQQRRQCEDRGRPETRAVDEGSRQLLSFSREVRGLLKHQPGCTISFAKFVPVYHSHFGKQCCVQNYGFAKLIDLLEAIPHVVQILGDQKSLTLTHREQVRRFVSDLVRVLRAQSDHKKLLVEEIGPAFESFFKKPFSLAEYGVCFMDDLLADVWEGSVLLLPGPSGDSFVSVEIPHREQTLLEKSRTKTFVREVVELLKTMPSMRIPFSKFIPTYHHMFGRQCRLSDYGFHKLADLFDSMTPLTIEIKKRGQDDEDLICLSPRIRAKVLWERLTCIMRSKRNCSLSRIFDVYRERYGHSLTADDFASKRLTQLLQTFSRTGSTGIQPHNYVRTTRTYANYRKGQVPPEKWMQIRSSDPPPSSSFSRTSPPSFRIRQKGVSQPQKDDPLEAEVISESSGNMLRKSDGESADEPESKSTHKITKRLAIRFDPIP